MRASTWIGVLLALLASLLLARLTDLRHALSLLPALGLSLSWLVLPYVAATTACALPWALLLPRASRPRWLEVISTRFASAAVNVVIPSGLAGEPVRLGAVDPAHRAAAGEALVWDRALYFVASGLFVFIIALGTVTGGRAFTLGAIGAGAAYLLAAGVLAGATRVMALRRLSWRLLAWFGRRRVRPEGQVLALMPTARVAAAGLSLHFLARILLALELWVGAWLLGIDLGFAEWLFVAGAVTLTNVAMPVVPGQVGVQEAALAGALLALGHDPSAGLALGLMVRLRQLVSVPLGLALVAWPLRRDRDRGSTPAALRAR